MNIQNEKISKALELQAQGVAIESIAEQAGYGSVKSLTRAMNKNGYSCKKGIFVPKTDAKPVENTGFATIELHIAKLVKAVNEVLELLKTEANKKQLKIEPRKLELKQTSIRVDAEVYKKFDEFCDQYDNVQRAYLYTVALEEFMKNHS